MELSTTDIKRAVGGALRFNSKDFLVQGSVIGKNISLAKSSSSSGSLPAIVFGYHPATLNPKPGEITSPGSTFSAGKDYATQALGRAALLTKQGPVDTLAQLYLDQAQRQSDWNGYWQSGTNNYPATPSTGIVNGSQGGSERRWLGLPYNIATFPQGLDLSYAYKSCSLFATDPSPGTQVGASCTARGCMFRLLALVTQSGVPLNWRISYDFKTYLVYSQGESFSSISIVAEATVISQTLISTVASYVDVSFNLLTVLQSLEIPLPAIATLPWPTVPTDPNTSGLKTLGSENYTYQFTISITSVTPTP